MLPSSSTTGWQRFGSGLASRATSFRRRRSAWIAYYAFVALLFFLACFLWLPSVDIARSSSSQGSLRVQGSQTSRRSRGKNTASWRPLGGKAEAPTLVLYVYGGSDLEYENNFKFFLREGVQEGDGCDYIIALQHGEGLRELDPLPDLPSNAHYMHHPNKCFDLGTVGWMLGNAKLDTRRYKYFILLNSSVRGPFMPAYLRGAMHWTTAFTSKLSDSVKLVGSTINCGLAYDVREPVAHVQTYAVATDQAGLAVLRAQEGVFHCWDNMAEVVVHSELGASKAITDAGFNLDCLMLRYQGLDWRDTRTTACNAHMNPIQQDFYDNINVDPLEVMFIKVKEKMRAAGWGHVMQALKYERWADDTRHTLDGYGNYNARMDAIASNEWLAHKDERIAEAMRRGADCFDFQFYVDANRFDLGFLLQQPDPLNAAFGHFVGSGILEGRPYRFTC